MEMDELQDISAVENILKIKIYWSMVDNITGYNRELWIKLSISIVEVLVVNEL